MFNNTKPNVILISDSTDVLGMPKTLGPYKVAHVLREHGIEVAVIHHASIFSIREILHALTHLISKSTLYVGVNNMFYADTGDCIERQDGGIEFKNIESGSILPHGKSFNAVVKKKIKECNPNCKLVFGGPTARDGEHARIFDYVVTGYAECSALNLAFHLMDPAHPLEKSRKSVWGPIIVDDSRAEKYDFSHGCMKYQDHVVILPGETLVLELARGCIFKCAFCSYPMNGKKKMDFIRVMDLVRQEIIENYEKFGVTRYIFSDDTINDSPEKCQMIYEMSKGLPFELEWWGYLRLDLLAAHPETIDWIFGSGCRSAFFGIETLHPEAAKAVGKGGNREKLFAVVKQIKDRYGQKVNLHGAFVFGLPHEPESSMEKTVDFLLSDECLLDSWIVQPLNIRPQGQTYDNGFLSDLDINFEKYGYRNMGQKSSDGNVYTSFRQETGQMVWANEHTDRLRVEKLIIEAYKRKNESSKNIISGISAFSFAGLGLSLDSFLNTCNQDHDWNLIDQKKLQRANLYKKILFEKCGVPEILGTNQTSNTTFSDWLKSKSHLEI